MTYVVLRLSGGASGDEADIIGHADGIHARVPAWGRLGLLFGRGATGKQIRSLKQPGGKNR